MSILADAGAEILDRQRARGKRLEFELERPHVSAHEGELRAERMRRFMEERRRELRERGVVSCATCPAASMLGVSDADGLAVRCAVERSRLTERTSPSSLTSFCLGDYTECPSWRAEKEREWHGNRSPLVGAHEGV